MRIGVVIASPAFDVPAMKFLATEMNTRQQVFEFEFLPADEQFSDPLLDAIDERLVDREHVRGLVSNFIERYVEFLCALNEDFDLRQDPPEYFVILSMARYGYTDEQGVLRDSNWFSLRKANASVLALGNWKRSMAPPSLIEFVLTLLIREGCARISPRLSGNVHLGSKGCLFDFCQTLEDARLRVLMGFVCEYCRSALAADGHGEAATALVPVLDRSWLGRSDDPAAPAGISANLGVDLFISKGLKPTPWERFVMTMQEETARQLIRIVFAVLLAVLAVILSLRL